MSSLVLEVSRLSLFEKSRASNRSTNSDSCLIGGKSFGQMGLFELNLLLRNQTKYEDVG